MTDMRGGGTLKMNCLDHLESMRFMYYKTLLGEYEHSSLYELLDKY